MIAFKPYPEITNEAVKTEWKFFGNNRRELKNENMCLRYKDNNEYFNYESENLLTSCQIKLNEITEYLKQTGHTEGLKAKIAIRCNSSTSRQRFLGESKEIKLLNNQDYDATIKIPKSNLRGEAEFELLILNDSETEKFSMPIGSIIFKSEPNKIRIDGKGSIFPVVYVNENQKSLWWLTLNIESPEDEITVDTIRININKSHPDFKKVCSKDGEELTDTVVLKNIFSGAIIQLLVFFYAKDDWMKEINEEKYNHIFKNSIGGLIRYWCNYLWEDINPIEEPHKLFEKLNEKLDVQI